MTNTQLGFQTVIYMAELELTRHDCILQEAGWLYIILYKYRCYKVDLGYGAKTIINTNKKYNSMFISSPVLLYIYHKFWTSVLKFDTFHIPCINL